MNTIITRKRKVYGFMHLIRETNNINFTALDKIPPEKKQETTYSRIANNYRPQKIIQIVSES